LLMAGRSAVRMSGKSARARATEMRAAGVRSSWVRVRGMHLGGSGEGVVTF
jgi:hypothetical protein